MKHLAYLVLLVFCLSGCTHALHQYQTGDYQPISSKRPKTISSLGEQNGFLGFRFDTNYVDQAWQALQAQCPRGTIAGVNTRYSTSHAFFSWNNQIKMTALCYEN